MQNKHLDQEIRIAQSKIEQKKREFYEIQSMDVGQLRQIQKETWQESPEFQDRQRRIEQYLELRNNAQLKYGDAIEPTKYSLSPLTIQECRKLHQKLKEKKALYREQIKITDNADLNSRYWKMYSEFMQGLNTNQHNASQMAQDIAQIKGYISILDQPPDFGVLKVSSKEPLSQDTIDDLEKRYEKLSKRVQDKEIDDLDVSQLMNKAKRYFQQQYGPPSPKQLREVSEGSSIQDR